MLGQVLFLKKYKTLTILFQLFFVATIDSTDSPWPVAKFDVGPTMLKKRVTKSNIAPQH